MTKIIKIDNKWYMQQGSIQIRLDPQPHPSDLRFNGDEWELYLGYPIGHDVPKFNLSGKWRNDNDDTRTVRQTETANCI